jgi:hypothetical protein
MRLSLRVAAKPVNRTKALPSAIPPRFREHSDNGGAKEGPSLHLNIPAEGPPLAFVLRFRSFVLFALS